MASSDDDETFSAQFGALDELIQLIYQGPSKFVVLSSVSDAGWAVHLGLTGAGGRWWEGVWTERDFEGFIVSSLPCALCSQCMIIRRVVRRARRPHRSWSTPS